MEHASELVAIRAASAATFVRAWDQATATGNAVLPLDPAAPESRTAAAVKHLRPSVLMVPLPGHPDRLHTVRLRESRPVPPGTSLVVQTSGSTGPPKGVLLSGSVVDAGVRASLDRLGAERGERWLLCLPWHHVAGLAVILRSRALGTDPVLHDGFDVDRVAEDVEAGRAQWVSLVPTQLRRLLDAGAPLSRLRGVLLGGAAADRQLLADADAAGVRVITSYGMTETFGGCVYDGLPLEGVTTDVLPDGRIRLGGPTVADGYHLDAAATMESFRGRTFTTNDLGRLDDEGRLHVLGRRDDVIVSGGENVPAGQVEEVIGRHPAVADVAVFGLADELWGHVVAAVIVPGEGARLTLDDLRDHVASELPRAWSPRRIGYAGAIPRTSLGKPNLPALRRLVR